MKIEIFEAVEIFFSAAFLTSISDFRPTDKVDSIADTEAWRQWVNERIQISRNPKPSILLQKTDSRFIQNVLKANSAVIEMVSFQITEVLENAEALGMIKNINEFIAFNTFLMVRK